MEGYGPEVSIFKAMYQHTGLASAEHVADDRINSVMEIISSFVNGCEAKACTFDDIYDSLQRPPYGVRKGIIPLFIVYVLRKYKENIIIYYKGKEVEISAQILSALNESPKDYSLLLEKGTKEKEELLNNLERIFSQYLDKTTAGTNKVYAVVKSMQTWIRSLPEFSKRFLVYYSGGVERPVDNSVKVIRNDLLKFEINAHEMLFTKWPTKLSPSGNLKECADEIKRVKKMLDKHVHSYKHELLNYIVALFVPGYSGSLSESMRLWYEKLAEDTRKHIFDSDANNLLTLANTWSSFDDLHLLNEMSMIFVSMAIEDWTDSLAKQFNTQIARAIDRINGFVEVKKDEQDCKLAISLPDGTVEKSFSGSEISLLGKTALSNLRAVFEEYNDSIEPDEQLAIIATLIRDIVN